MGQHADEAIDAMFEAMLDGTLYEDDDMPRRDNSIVEVRVELLHETEAAVLVSDGDTESWLPKKLIVLPDDYADQISFDVRLPLWLAEEKGLV